MAARQQRVTYRGPKNHTLASAHIAWTAKALHNIQPLYDKHVYQQTLLKLTNSVRFAPPIASLVPIVVRAPPSGHHSIWYKYIVETHVDQQYVSFGPNRQTKKFESASKRKFL